METPMTHRLQRSFGVLSIALAGFAAPAFADKPGDDMLTPDEIQETGISANPANDSGFYLGAGLGFGQARTTEEGNSPGVGYMLKLEPGYQFNRGGFGRFEVGASLFTGKGAFRTKDSNLGKVDVTMPFGLLARVGYGYSMGSKMFGVASLAAGPVMSKIELDPGIDLASDTESGFAEQLAWTMVMPTGASLDVTGGLSLTHVETDVGKVEGGGTSTDLDRTVITNLVSVEVGLRVRL
jgi:hypothetical protein